MGLPARAGASRRLLLHADYAWRHSASRLVTTAHAAWDTWPGAARAAVVSRAGGLAIGYAGNPEGLRSALTAAEGLRQPAADPAAGPGTDPAAGPGTDPAAGPPVRTAAGRGLAGADLVLLGVRAGSAHRRAGAAALVLPARVHFVVDIDADVAALVSRVSRRERQEFAGRQRQHGWTWHEVRDLAWFDEFYAACYRPTMRRRHGEEEHVESAALAHECLFRDGRLFALTENGTAIGGALCHWQRARGVLTVRLIGVRDGAEQHYRSGAFKAVYHFLLRWSAGNGVRQLDFQGAEPFLSLGLYQWKRRFGGRVIVAPNHFGRKRLLLAAVRDTPRARDFLAANPVLAEQPDGTLEAVYFYDAARPARLHYPAGSGIDRVREVLLDDFLAGLPASPQPAAPAPLAPALRG